MPLKLCCMRSAVSLKMLWQYIRLIIMFIFIHITSFYIAGNCSGCLMFPSWWFVLHYCNTFGLCFLLCEACYSNSDSSTWGPTSRVHTIAWLLHTMYNYLNKMHSNNNKQTNTYCFCNHQFNYNTSLVSQITSC